MNKNLIKKLGVVAGTVLFFIVVAFAFTPESLKGKIVNQSDISGYTGMANQAKTWDASHPDDPALWTESMFGGMPTLMITGNHKGDLTKGLYDMMFIGVRPPSYFILMMVGAYLMLLAFGINGILAALGAVMIAFCSYNAQIIQVGHNTKMVAMAFLPWAVAAFAFTYRSVFRKETFSKWLPKALLGSALFALAISFQIKADHVQISYYLAIILLCYAVAVGVYVVVFKENRGKIVKYVTASLMMLSFGIVGIGVNANKIIPVFNYTKETMRGGSELAAERSADVKTEKTGGLDFEYATSWSYGWEELPNMMIRNFNGGSSATKLSSDSKLASKLKREYGPQVNTLVRNFPLYWGPQPFTAGPMYIGGIVIFLFIFGLLVTKGDRWWILAATLIAIFLGVGKYFRLFSEFWFYHVPFYNKFRTVSMALIILQYTLPLLGLIALNKVFRNRIPSEVLKKKAAIAFGITGGFCLLIALIPSIAGVYMSQNDLSMFPSQIIPDIVQERIDVCRHDAIVTFVLILLSYLCLLWGDRMNRRKTASVLICVLAAGNIVMASSDYLNKSHFTYPKDFTSKFIPTEVDQNILLDDEQGFRVVDLSASTFNDSRASYHHRNIGGYSPVKLQRYQDLIDNHLQKEIESLENVLSTAESVEDFTLRYPSTPVMSMLNCKYIILSEDLALINPDAMGACWFVNEALQTDTYSEEIASLSEVDLHEVAVIGKDFSSASESVASGSDTDEISLIEYTPNRIRYAYSASSKRTAVLSEVYYPRGWKAVLEDGTEVPLFRANWILRGVSLPSGDHELTLTFQPESYTKGAAISRLCSVLIYLLLLAGIAGLFLTRKKN